MRKYLIVVLMIPAAVIALAVTFPLMNLIGVPEGQELSPFVVLFSVTFGVLTSICFGLLGLRLVKRDGNWLIIDPKEERKKSEAQSGTQQGK